MQTNTQLDQHLNNVTTKNKTRNHLKFTKNLAWHYMIIINNTLNFTENLHQGYFFSTINFYSYSYFIPDFQCVKFYFYSLVLFFEHF